MDVHRLKFLDVKPSPILSLSFSNVKSCQKLAISRGDGSIEIWNVVNEDKRELCHQITIPGREDVSVDSILWCGERLFSAGLTGSVSEWGLLSLQLVRSAEALGSPILCLDKDSTHTRLAAGAEDGKICLFDVSNDVLELSRTLDNQNCRILSLSWHPSNSQIAIGCSDSTLRIIDVESGHCTLRITLDKMSKAETLVWSVKFLPDFTIVSGSSAGKVQFWNGRFGTLRHDYQSHLADVLALCVDDEGETVYASGVDAKVVQFKRVVEGDGMQNWVQCRGVRAHSHEVKSLAVGSGSSGSCLVSGGVDTELVAYSAEQFDPTKINRFSPFSSWSGRFKVATGSNTLLYQGRKSLRFWRITPKSGQNGTSSSTPCSPDKDALQGSSHSPSPSGSLSNLSLPSLASSVESDLLISSGLPVHFLEISASSSHHILSSALSADGSLVAFSDGQKTWIYRIGVKVVCIFQGSISASSIAVKHDNSEIVLGLSKGGLQRSKVATTAEGRSQLNLEMVLKQKDKSSYVFCELQYNHCGSYVLAVNRKFRMFLYETSTFSCLAKLPRLSDYCMPHVVFNQKRPLIHIFASSDKSLYDFNIKTGTLNLLGSLNSTKSFHGRQLLGSSVGISLSVCPNHLFVFDNNTLAHIGCTPTPTETIVRPGNKRKRESSVLNHKLFNQHKELLFVSLLQCGELLVVEKPWTEVLKELPPVLERDRYGT